MKDEKIIYNLLKIILISACILIIKIIITPKYDPQIYAEVYAEYAEIEKNNEKNNENNIDCNTTDNNRNVIYMYSGINSGNKKYTVDGKITIPKINIEYPVVKETSEEYLKVAPTKFAGPNMNEMGNYCIAGHNYYNNQFFSKVSQLEINDEIYLTTNEGKSLKYFVYKKYEVYENDLSCTNQDTNGKTEATLITCTTQKKKRLIVKCRVN